MKHSQHTPGPWTLDEPGSLTITFEGVPVAKALDNCDTREETQANARLIAAAPELVEALKTAVVAFDADDYTLAVNLMDGVRALLSRIEAQQ